LEQRLLSLHDAAQCITAPPKRRIWSGLIRRSSTERIYHRLNAAYCRFLTLNQRSDLEGVIAAATTHAIWLMQEPHFEVRFAPINGNGQHRGALLLSANIGNAGRDVAA